MASPHFVELGRAAQEMEYHAYESAANTRKFVFACQQFRNFLNLLVSASSTLTFTPIIREQISHLLSSARTLSVLFSQHRHDCWAYSALEFSVTHVPQEVCQVINRFQEIANNICPDASIAFDPNSPQWLQFHILDLMAIKTSFEAYVEKHEDDAAQIMERKIHDINNFLKSNESAGSSGAVNHVFSPLPINYHNWRIRYDAIEFGKEVATGSSAVVYYGHYDGQPVAIKKLKYKKLVGPKLQSYQREIAILATAKHPTILKFIGATDSAPYCILTEWMEGGSLFDALYVRNSLNPTDLTIAAFDIARSLQFLHSRGMIHRDVKSLNVLISGDNKTRLCDFGFSREMAKGKTMTQNVGTPHWMAPELLMQESYDTKIDVYSYGIMLSEMITKHLPYDGLEMSQIISEIFTHNLRPCLYSNNPNLLKLTQQCWDGDPAMRPSFDQIIQQFVDGEIIFEGADPILVARYIRQITESEITEIQSTLKSLESEDTMTESLISLMERGELHESIVSICWKYVNRLPKTDPLFLRGIRPFLTTSYSGKASEILRKMIRVPPAIVKIAVNQLPTGNSEVDLNLVVIACKNHYADYALVVLVESFHQQLALECIVARGMTHFDLTKQVIAVCLRCLDSTDPDLVMSALKCLVKVKATKEIEFDRIRMHVMSSHRGLKCCVLITLLEMVNNDGIPLPESFLSYLSSLWQTNELAMLVCIASCKNLENANIVLDRLGYGSQPPNDAVMRILIKASDHRELRHKIMRICCRFAEFQNDSEITVAVKLLKKRLNGNK